MLSVELREVTSPVNAATIRQILGLATVSITGALLVSNQRLTRAADELLRRAQEGGANAFFIQWRDENDTGALKEAVIGVLREVGNPGTSGA
ncbi:hypothetical protein OG471_30665 [Streptomyces sp. NBC_01336]|uniref:hypothetical protein n=1 Tax=Streptomyces sp. NBC_01336 TaxID=2903829 RepID=UPI002E10982D|nr:hypothetical protein OG471_30665 [Streptomyces sp. NBC_01336]